MFARIVITHSMHAVLLQRYDLDRRRHVEVGDSRNQYGPVDSATGAEYKCLGQPCHEGKHRGKVSYSSDLVVGHFYPEAIIITGFDDKGVSLTHEQIECFKNSLRQATGGRVILPKGYDKGKMTWENGWKYYPDYAPNWYGLEEELQRKYPGVEIYRPPQCSWIELYFNDAEFGDKFTYKEATPA